MVVLKARRISGKTYYYLGHTYRKDGKVKYKETYIGNKLPRNIEQIKKNFLIDIYKERWFSIFEKIKKRYSKEQHAMPEEIKIKELENFVIRFTYDTNRIEGSKLSFKDTNQLLEMGISPKNKPISDIKEAEAHRKVFFEVVDFDGDISSGIVLKWHEELFLETKLGIAGKIRTYQVYISGSRHIPPAYADVQKYITELFRWYSIEKTNTNAVELAARIHIKFESIHPFGDGNGRIGRLIMNFVLHKNGYPMMNIKYADRRGYYNALERSNVKGDEDIFVQWFFKRYVKENARYLKSK